MFTGIVQGCGYVLSVVSTALGRRLAIDIGALPQRPELGGSVAINGACLTVVERAGSAASFDVVAETLAKTTLGELAPGDRVNLELALRMSNRIEGHFVLGHVDTTCRIVRIIDEPPGKRYGFQPTDALYLRYIVPKGSVAVDGISLTVAERRAGGFEAAIIPETLTRTTLGQKQPGSIVNLETDVLVKAVVQQMAWGEGDGDARLMEQLRESGFAP